MTTPHPATPSDTPPVTQSIYTPSGKWEINGLPWLALGGVLGLIIGVITAAAAGALGALLFWLASYLEKVGTFLYVLNCLLYYLAPLWIPIMSGVFLGKFLIRAHCRSVPVAIITGLIFAIINIIPMLVMGVLLRGTTYHYLNYYVESLEFISPEAMMGPMGRYLMWALAAIGVIIVPMKTAKVVRQAKYCEQCHAYLTSKVFARVSLAHLPAVLDALGQSDLAQITALPALPEKRKWQSTDERVEVTLHTCPCGLTAFAQATTYTVVVKDGTTIGEERLVFQRPISTSDIVRASLTPAAPPAAEAIAAAQQFDATRQEQIAQATEEIGRAQGSHYALKAGIGLVFALLFMLYSGYQTVEYYRYSRYPVANGRITRIDPSGWRLDTPVTIVMEDGNTVHAEVRGKDYDTNRTVRVHYSGKTGDKVILVGQENPLWITLIMLVLSLICTAIILVYRRPKKTDTPTP